MIFGENFFSCYTLLPDQISLSGCLYFMRYWAMCVFAKLAVMPEILKLTFYLFNQAVFSTRPKSQNKSLNILRTKRAFKMK